MTRVRSPQRSTRDQKGVSLLLALLIVATITAAGAGAAAIIIIQNRTTASIDTGIAAYYAADMGMERALYTVSNNRMAGSILFVGFCQNDACSQIRNNQPPMSGQPGFAGDEQYTLSVNETKETQTVTTIKKDETFTIDLTQGDPTFTTNAPQTLYLTASDIEIPPGDEDVPSAEVQWTFYLRRKDASTELQPANSTIRVISKLNMKYGVKIDLFTGNVSSLDLGNAPSIVPNNPSGLTEIPSGYNATSITGWNVKVKAITDDVPNVVAWACTGSDPCNEDAAERFAMKSIFSITSRGRAGGSSFVLNAKVPVRLPPSGIFDYALFSEQTLEKPD